MSGSARPERVGEEFREILAEEIPRLKDPRVGFVTVIHVDVTHDLRRATVYYTVFGQEKDHRRTRAGLESARSHLRTVLGQQVRLKFIPELDFREDEGLSHLERVSQLLREVGLQPSPEEAHVAGESGEGEQAEDESASG